MPRENRRLAAIVAADIVGFSRLVGQDEEGTLRALRAHRAELIDPLIEAHGGRIANTAGDSLLLEFPSAVDAVRCAIAVQEGMSGRNIGVEADRRIDFRIGVNVGDVVVEGGDLLGDGVNLAARLEGWAEPGGIALSAAAHDYVDGRLEIRFNDGGRQTLKNIAEPVRLWHWVPGAQSVPAKAPDPELAPPLPDKPSIAVLPFDNMSGDPEQEYFADGLSEDLITALSYNSLLFVIARNSSFTYKGRAVDVTEVSRDLGVQYVLEGSVRKAGNRIRVTVQLIDGLTGRHVWAERYDRELDDIFELQDEITASIAIATDTQVSLNEAKRSGTRSRAEISDLDAVYHAINAIWTYTAEGAAEARAILEEILSGNPGNVMATALLASAHILFVMVGRSQSPQADTAAALELARRAVALDDTQDFAHLMVAISLHMQGKHAQALPAMERAMEINPHTANNQAMMGAILAAIGRPEEGLDLIHNAARSDPRSPMTFLRHSELAGAYFMAGDDDTAIDWARRSIQRRGDYVWSHLVLIAALGRAGRLEEAAVAVSELRAVHPRASVTRAARSPIVSRPEYSQALADGLRAAGLPEG